MIFFTCFPEQEPDSWHCLFYLTGEKRRESVSVRQVTAVVKFHLSLGIENKGFYGCFSLISCLSSPVCPAPWLWETFSCCMALSCGQPPKFIFLIWPTNFIPVAICLNKEPGECSRAWGYSMKISRCFSEQLRRGTALSQGKSGWAFRAG